MKKLFTFLVLVACFMGAKAEEVVDLEVDYATITSDAWNGGWRSDDAAVRTEIVPGEGIHFFSEEATDPLYNVQFQLPGVPSGKLDNDALYTITIKIKGTVAQNIHGYFSGSDLPGDIPVTSEWQTLTFEGCQNNPNAQYFASSGAILIQCGDYVGEWWISYIKITHDEKAPTRPTVWQELLTDDGVPFVEGEEHSNKWMGDANTPWGDRANTVFTDTENTIYVCAWSKEKGHNMNADQGWDPFPAEIVADPDDPSNKVFVCHGQPATTEGDASAWDNQFWIMSTKELKVGAEYKFHFKYKASENANTNTQMHSAQPSDYLHYAVLGDVGFTTEWQTYDAVVAIPTPQNNKPIYSIAFNLNAQNKNAIEFYFDDLSIQEMKLDEGYFVAGSNSTTGLDYDYDNAIQFVEGVDPGNEPCLVATIGTEGKQDTWVNEIMISTVCGNTKAFKANTIKPNGAISGDNVDDWKDYEPGSSAKIKVAAGVWKIYIAPDEDPSKVGVGQILFMQVEGEKPQEPVAIVTNTTAIVVHGLEREDLIDEWNAQTSTLNVREEADENPDDEHGIGGAGHTGQTWDNQFFFKSNRALEKGEVTVLKFKYKASKDANTTTQCHGETPGNYMHWAAIGDVTFSTEWQDFEKEFTIPNEADGMWCIAFNMAEIREACDYEITDVQWYLKGDENAEGKTMLNLINETGSSNFYVKEGAGTTPYIFGGGEGIFTVTNHNVTTDSNVIYNLSGQRVGADYKGIVIKNGKKVVVK